MLRTLLNGVLATPYRLLGHGPPPSVVRARAGVVRPEAWHLRAASADERRT